MNITSRQFLVVKDGNPPEHNDDALAGNEDRNCFAISDGVTESGFSRIWSRVLVEEFVRLANGCPNDDWSIWLPVAQKRWLDELESVEIPWYGEKQFEEGAFATFLGVVFIDNQESTNWIAVAVGDSCLFHTRGGVLLSSFPLGKSSQFNSVPRLIGSRSPVNEVVDKRAQSIEGVVKRHDRIWLTSDALAQWCLAQEELGRSAWEEMERFLQPSVSDVDFRKWVEELRADRGLHNDDVVLLAIEL